MPEASPWDQRTRTGEYVPKPSDSLITRALKATTSLWPTPGGIDSAKSVWHSNFGEVAQEPQQPRLHARAE